MTKMTIIGVPPSPHPSPVTPLPHPSRFCSESIGNPLTLPMICSADELGEETAAFEREYAEDHSWEELQEDEQGRLRPLVC